MLRSEGWYSGFACKSSRQRGRFALHEQVLDQQNPSIMRTQYTAFVFHYHWTFYFGLSILAFRAAGTRLLYCFIIKKQ